MHWWLILVPALGVALIALAFAVRAGRSRTSTSPTERTRRPGFEIECSRSFPAE
jgi:hypothetical protein